MDKVKCIIELDGTKAWWLNDELHREDGPAVIDPDGTIYWCLNNKCHREDGPAIIESDGSIMWCLYNQRYLFNDWCSELKLSKEKIIELKMCYG